tara:strand:- start:421 stop:909 length:489 start_codon:yes stop_codon:yes gene_type:complete
LGEADPASFLSCLRGSEPLSSGSPAGAVFLSCLRGSEPTNWPSAPRMPFLSCLRGSEQFPDIQGAVVKFLSCLRGSEQRAVDVASGQGFLSCLRGSELEHSEHNPLIPLQQSSDRPNNPILHFRAKPLINIDFSRALEKGSELNGEPMVDSTLRLGSSTARG